MVGLIRQVAKTRLETTGTSPGIWTLVYGFKILETAQWPNSSFPLWPWTWDFDLPIGKIFRVGGWREQMFIFMLGLNNKCYNTEVKLQ